jgi:5'-nucleotidase / UDP-sugar diphosphatase
LLEMKKLLLLLPLFVLFLCGAAQQTTTGNGQLKKLTILYTNDLHANFDPIQVGWISETRKVGGFANIATIVKDEKRADTCTLYLDAGDFFTGPDFCSLTKGEAVIDVMNHMSVDAACIGNHEFDYGWQNMLDQFGKATFPIVNGNIFISKADKLIWNNPYIILKKNGIRIGIIGLHGKFAFYDTVADKMRSGIEARDEEKYLSEYIDVLKGQTDIIVLLVHEGIPGRQSSKGSDDISRNLQKDIELAQKVKGIDILITGHAHQGTPQALTSNGTIIVSTDALGIEVGKLEIQYDKQQDKIASYTNTLNYVFDDEFEDDVTTQQAIEKWRNKLAEITDEIVCKISQPLTRSYGEESLLGDMVADAMLHSYPDNELVLINSGGLREDIAGPVVTTGNLISAFPFPNTVVQLELTGNDLKELLEHSAGLTNGILQTSKGTVIKYNESFPVGKRVTYCSINGKLLDEKSTYKILTNNFLAEGGDGFLAFKKATAKKDTHIEVIQTMIEYLKTFDTYNPRLQGRVVKVKE